MGGLLNGIFGGGQQTVETRQKQELDPDMKRRMLTLMDRGDALYQKNPSGMNDMMRAGMEMQRQQLTDPSYSKGYNQQRNLAQMLMGGGGVGNPFSRGGGGMASLMGGALGGALGGMGGGGMMGGLAGGGLLSMLGGGQKPQQQPQLPAAAMQPIGANPQQQAPQAPPQETQMRGPQYGQEQNDFLEMLRRREQDMLNQSMRY